MKFNIIHLKHKDIKPLRNKLFTENNAICPILKQKIKENEAVLDHIHKRKQTDDITQNSGVIRNTIHSGANVFLGKIENAYLRFIPKDYNIDLPTLLRNVADYIENGAYIENNTLFSHPSENFGGDMIKMKRIPLSKRKYNELSKIAKEHKVKIPPYVKYMDKKIYELLVKFSLLD